MTATYSPSTGKTAADPSAEPAAAAVRASKASLGERLRRWHVRLLRPADQPAWARPALLGLLVATALLYLWGLGESGWANSFYSAAAQAGSESWKAFFFGSSDAGNSITVDKTPASLWVMALSVRIFGLSSWSHPRARGADRCGRGGRALRHRPALVRRRSRAAGRGRDGAHPGGRAHVPVQQPGRAVGAAARDRGLRRRPGDRDGQHPLADPGRRDGRLRVPDQDAAGPAGRAGVRPGLPGGRPDHDRAPHPAAADRRRRDGRLGGAGGSRSSSSSRHRPAPTSAAPRPTASSNSRWATTASVG